MSYHVSASQIDTYLDCNRKWGWRYLDGIETPSAPSAELGSRVHAILEDWLQFARPPNYDEVFRAGDKEWYPGRIAMEAIPLLPPPGPHLIVERQFKLKHWVGRIDLTYLAGPSHPVVMDHKTTSNLAYAKTPADLLGDPQANLYAAVAFHELPHAKHVDLAWTYMLTSKPYRAKRVHLRVVREQVSSMMQVYDEIATDMLTLRQSNKRARDLPYNVETCQKYGGCPHISRCQLSSEELMRAKMTQELNLIEKIAAAKAAAARAAGTPEAALPPPMIPPQIPQAAPPPPPAPPP
ncbi:MAG: PD-(D/E)XK nuclease family protein, partial [Microbacterium sp.]